MTETPSPASDATPARAPRARKKPASTRTRGARRKPARAKKSKRAGTAGLSALLSDLSTRMSKTGTRIAAQASEGAASARSALGKAKGASQRAIRASMREWNKLDTPRKVEFVAALLSALATASGTIAARKKKK
jgi:hypothetical protein